MPRKAKTTAVDIKTAYNRMISKLTAKNIEILTFNFTAVNYFLDALGYERQPWPRDCLPFGTGINEPCERVLIHGSCQVGEQFIREVDNTAWEVVFYQTEKGSSLIGGDTVYWIAMRIDPNKKIRIKSKTPSQLAHRLQQFHLGQAVSVTTDSIIKNFN